MGAEVDEKAAADWVAAAANLNGPVAESGHIHGNNKNIKTKKRKNQFLNISQLSRLGQLSKYINYSIHLFIVTRVKRLVHKNKKLGRKEGN